MLDLVKKKVLIRFLSRFIWSELSWFGSCRLRLNAARFKYDFTFGLLLAVVDPDVHLLLYTVFSY